VITNHENIYNNILQLTLSVFVNSLGVQCISFSPSINFTRV